jgi:hypothetical protein
MVSTRDRASTWTSVLGSVAIAALSGCDSRASQVPYEFILRVESDPGHPLAGAIVQREGTRVGVSGSDGSVRLSVGGIEGETVGVDVRCPEGFRSPTSALRVVLRRVSESARLPEYSASCPPMERSIVIAVRADNAQNLPVLYLGQEVARLDASGAAHVALTVPTETQLTLTLGTDEPGADQLRPQNPSGNFVVHAQDDVLVFDQRFKGAEPVRPSPRRAAPRPQGPIRLK